jgi:hypothetical protein
MRLRASLLSFSLMLATAALTPFAADAASPSQVPPESCTNYGTGSPGNISFTAHIYDSCHHPMKAYCDHTGTHNTGNVVTSDGYSKTSCEAPDTYGYEVDFQNGNGYIEFKLGSQA